MSSSGIKSSFSKTHINGVSKNDSSLVVPEVHSIKKNIWIFRVKAWKFKIITFGTKVSNKPLTHNLLLIEICIINTNKRFLLH